MWMASKPSKYDQQTCITHNGMKYNMDVEFKSGLCNCQPSKIPEYGEYKWETPFKLIDGIPKLPDILFNMICNPETQAPTVSEPKAPYDNNMVRQMWMHISKSIGQLQYLDPIGNDIDKHWSTIRAMGRIEHEKQEIQNMHAIIYDSSSQKTKTLLAHQDIARKKVISICTTRPSASNMP